jgi:hypothetical protein
MGRHNNFKNWQKFHGIIQSKVFFSRKTPIKEERIAMKLKMGACGKIGKLEMLFY